MTAAAVTFRDLVIPRLTRDIRMMALGDFLPSEIADAAMRVAIGLGAGRLDKATFQDLEDWVLSQAIQAWDAKETAARDAQEWAKRDEISFCQYICQDQPPLMWVLAAAYPKYREHAVIVANSRREAERARA